MTYPIYKASVSGSNWNFRLLVILPFLTFLSGCTTRYVVEHERKPISALYTPKSSGKLALLVPFSGEHAKIGESILESSMLALKKSGTDIEVIVIDSEKIKHNISEVIHSIRKNRIDYVIGPVFAQDAETISKEVPDVSFFSLSNDKNITASNVVVFGLDPEEEITTLFEHAAKLGKRKILALIPNSRYGSVINRAINAANVQDVKKIRYDSMSEESVNAILQGDEYDAIFSVTSRHIPSWANKKMLVLLPYNKQNVFDSNINDSLICAPNQNSKKIFEQDFLDNYGHEPEDIAIIAFDILALAVDILSRNGSFFDVFNKTYEGALGTFVINEDRTVSRDLKVYKNVH